MSGLTCCCSIVSVVCIWYIDFLPPHCLGSLAIILVGMSTVSVGNVCFHTWLTSPMLRTHTLSDVVNRVFLSVMSQMLNFFLTVSISWDNMWHHKTTCLAVRMAIVKNGALQMRWARIQMQHMTNQWSQHVWRTQVFLNNQMCECSNPGAGKLNQFGPAVKP